MRITRFLYSMCILLAIVSLSGCATVLNGSTQKVKLTTDPDDAKVYVNGVYFGETPVELELDTSQVYSVEFRKRGYESQGVLIGNKVGLGWVVIDLCLGVVPVFIDAVTGDWNTLHPNKVRVSLERE